ncbi:ABC transporter ATP-binding protein [Mesorhizobium sangaii]|uniref:NitT/TauT family transport system ATP-binding protein n=1 Tax=Mesorhizobium sangaii TaxID=505389 RepID=A0A841PJE9_9HYPH|nr:ABC transporter ATP-binding protein [Mesorhizobium sangaii]MBB6413763.1 NitT/TauT family transport system ATP-binding protein [Mesorhizobium sangaii]
MSELGALAKGTVARMNFPNIQNVRSLNVAQEKSGSIVASDVSKSFGEFEALGPVSVEIGEGEFVSILGPSGCGKSTLMLMIAGLLKPTRGSIAVNGRILTKPMTDVGIVFQDHLLLEFRTAFENVLLQQEIRGLDRAATEKRARELFKKLGLFGVETRYPRQLSGGMQQRVSIARSLVHDPSVLLMDEPFGALDAISRTQIRHDLEMLWIETRKSVLFITHSIEEAIGLSDRVLVMSNSPGRVVKEIRIDLPRPRPAYLGQYPEFSAYADEIYKTFEELGVYHFK